MEAKEKKAFEPTGLVPRSIVRTFERFRQQLLPGSETAAIREYRISRYQVLVSARCLFVLLTIPIATNWLVSNWLLSPLIEHFWNTQQNEIFLNSYQEERAFAELEFFSEKLFFESLLNSVNANNGTALITDLVANDSFAVTKRVKTDEFVLPCTETKDSSFSLTPSACSKFTSSGRHSGSREYGKPINPPGYKEVANKIFNVSAGFNVPKGQNESRSPLWIKLFIPSGYKSFWCNQRLLLYPERLQDKPLTDNNCRYPEGVQNVISPAFKPFSLKTFDPKGVQVKGIRKFPIEIAQSKNEISQSKGLYYPEGHPSYSLKVKTLLNNLHPPVGSPTLIAYTLKGYKSPWIISEAEKQLLHNNNFNAPIISSGYLSSITPWHYREISSNATNAIYKIGSYVQDPFIVKSNLVTHEMDSLKIKEKIQDKILELAVYYNQQTILSITNVVGDLVSIFTLGCLFIWMRPEITILKSFLIEAIYSLSDTTKSFLLILLTDLLVGFHSPRGWETALELLLKHFGLPENQDFVFLFVATFPVLLDTVFKYWIFRHLNKISPSTVATYHSMIE